MYHKFIIEYGKTPPENSLPCDDNGTKGFTVTNTDMTRSRKTDVRTVEFLLDYSKPITSIFVNEWIKNSKGTSGSDTEYDIQYNTSMAITSSKRLELQQKMNDVVLRLGEILPEYPIDQKLILQISPEKQLDKLNALHRYFEDTSYTLMQDDGIDIEVFDLLEKINQLVHTMEANDMNEDDAYHRTVIRNLQKIPKSMIYELTDEDYLSFETDTHNNALYLDFATVGKDLTACASTNDVELVLANEVKPQTHARPYVNFRVGKSQTSKTTDDVKADIKQWCTENNLLDHINPDEPRYMPGRIKLGVICDGTTYETFDNMIKEYPYIVGVYFE